MDIFVEETPNGDMASSPHNTRLKTDTGEILGTGWVPDMPDMRDYTPKTKALAKANEALGLKASGKAPKAGLPTKADLRKWCSPIENQRSLGSCTAQAAVGIVEYYERRAFNTYIDASKLFTYKTTRSLLGWVGDTGAYVRTTMGSLVLFGAAPEKYWPYTTNRHPGPDGKRTFDDEPSAFVYSLGDNYETPSYFSHDAPSLKRSRSDVVESVKTYAAYGIPTMFGFYGFDSFNYGDAPGHIPLPCNGERARWGHAICVVGYDDGKKIKNTKCNQSTTGAFLIRNSWGTGWGDSGYGWLPYEYALKGLARDFWSIWGMRWADTKKFGL